MYFIHGVIVGCIIGLVIGILIGRKQRKIIEQGIGKLKAKYGSEVDKLFKK